MENLEALIFGFLGGLVVFTWINTVRILWKVDKILKEKSFR